MDWQFYLLASVLTLLSLIGYSVDLKWVILGGPDRNWRLRDDPSNTSRRVPDERSQQIIGLAWVATVLWVIAYAFLLVVFFRYGWLVVLSCALGAWILRRIPVLSILLKLLISFWLLLGVFFSWQAIFLGWGPAFRGFIAGMRYLWTGRASPEMEAVNRFFDEE